MVRFGMLVIGFFISLVVSAQLKYDVLIVGGGASGVTAGIQSARMGVKTLILEEDIWLGGMLTSAGVSAIDGNHNLHGGLWAEFHDALVDHYGSTKALETGWVSKVLFEPSVGNRIWQEMVAREQNLSVIYQSKIKGLVRSDNQWHVTFLEKGKKKEVLATLIIDATELGDIANQLGVKSDVGMDARSYSGEDIAPEIGNNVVQDLTYVMILKDYGKDMTIKKPRNYKPELFYCTCQSDKCQDAKPGQALWPKESMINYGKLPNGKYMINWPIDGNDYYLNLLDMPARKRKKALKEAKEFSLGYLYYLQTELGFNHLGLADDEFPTKDRLPFIPYHRESRRIHGLVRFTVNDAARPFSQPHPLYRTGIAVGDYPVDHHHKRNPKWEDLPELHFYKIPSYSLPMGVMIPKGQEGLIVAEKSISVSNIVNGTTRLQPVVMQIGQAAGALAAISVQKRQPVEAVAVRDVQQAILSSGGYLLPYLDCKADHPHFKSFQRIGATGILKGEGMNVGWQNQTWLHVDSILMRQDLIEGFSQFNPDWMIVGADEQVTVGEVCRFVEANSKETPDLKIDDAQWTRLGLTNFDSQRSITRGEFAVLMDSYLDPFSMKGVDIEGFFID